MDFLKGALSTLLFVALCALLGVFIAIHGEEWLKSVAREAALKELQYLDYPMAIADERNTSKSVYGSPIYLTCDAEMTAKEKLIQACMTATQHNRPVVCEITSKVWSTIYPECDPDVLWPQYEAAHGTK